MQDQVSPDVSEQGLQVLSALRPMGKWLLDLTCGVGIKKYKPSPGNLNHLKLCTFKNYLTLCTFFWLFSCTSQTEIKGNFVKACWHCCSSCTQKSSCSPKPQQCHTGAVRDQTCPKHNQCRFSFTGKAKKLVWCVRSLYRCPQRIHTSLSIQRDDVLHQNNAQCWRLCVERKSLW